MTANLEFLSLIRKRARQRILFLPHAIRQMSRPDRMITPAEVRGILETGDLIEDYPEDARGHSALLLGQGNGGRALHVVCSPKDEYLAIITTYLPESKEWSEDFRMRK